MLEAYENYKYTLEQEVLEEVAFNLLHNFGRYFDNIGVSIDDKSNDLVKLYWQINSIRENIISEENNDFEKLNMIKGHLMYINDYINNL